MTPKHKGDLAVSSAIHYYMTHEYEVCLPIGDKSDYDLVVEKSGELYRVQVKYGGLYPGKLGCRVALRVMGGNQSFHYAKKYSARLSIGCMCTRQKVTLLNYRGPM
jgi:hypothetical protein